MTVEKVEVLSRRLISSKFIIFILLCKEFEVMNFKTRDNYRLVNEDLLSVKDYRNSAKFVIIGQNASVIQPKYIRSLSPIFLFIAEFSIYPNFDFSPAIYQ